MYTSHANTVRLKLSKTHHKSITVFHFDSYVKLKTFGAFCLLSFWRLKPQCSFTFMIFKRMARRI